MPTKICDVDKLVAKYATKEKELFRQLTFKYGPENYLSSADKTAIRSRYLSLNKIICKKILIY